ncbi:MAG: NUDIX hydrolase [Acidimicrobiia bacterium]|nr:NUDIX hydrolase [Acidimicrobiia bacterium]
MSETPILAAGGLVIRPDSDGTLRVLLVHRPRYGDWSLPKGKADPGEVPEWTAKREVEEETGVLADVIAPLAEVEYRVGSGRRKVVKYFAMRHRTETPFRPNDEVDEIRWLTPGQAVELATYDHDQSLLRSDLDALMALGTVWLVRHAAAGDRDSWNDDDRMRPLTRKGRKQAVRIADALFPHHVDAIFSSPYDRCRQTVEPLAERCGLPVEDSDHLAEGARDSATVEWIRGLGGKHVVACSHGDVIPAVIRRLEASGVPLYSPTGVFDVKKGSIWTLALEGDRVTAATYTPPPEV